VWLEIAVTQSRLGIPLIFGFGTTSFAYEPVQISAGKPAVVTAVVINTDPEVFRSGLRPARAANGDGDQLRFDGSCSQRHILL
jgi:hypothetical protein